MPTTEDRQRFTPHIRADAVPTTSIGRTNSITGISPSPNTSYIELSAGGFHPQVLEEMLVHSATSDPFVQSPYPHVTFATPILDSSRTLLGRTGLIEHGLPERRAQRPYDGRNVIRLPESRVTALQEPWQLNSSVSLSPFPGHQVAHQFITTKEKSAEVPFDTRAKLVVSKEPSIHKNWNLGVKSKTEEAWLQIDFQGPTSLASMLSSDRLIPVVSHLTRLAWLPQVDPDTVSHSRILLMKIAVASRYVLPTVGDPSLKRYLATLSRLSCHVELRPRKPVQFLGMIHDNKVFLRDTASGIYRIEDLDVVLMTNPSTWVATGESDADRNASKLQARSAEITDRPVPGSAQPYPSEAPKPSDVTKVATIADFRTHALYKAQPQGGKYYCKFQGCRKEPIEKKSLYNRHVDTHLSPFVCGEGECRQAFRRHDGLQNHRTAKHGIPVQSYRSPNVALCCSIADCPRATRGFTSTWHLRRHVDAHQKDQDSR